MANREVVPLKFGDQVVYMEVADIGGSAEGEWEEVGAAQEVVDAGERVTGTVRALAASVKEALAAAGPKEWILEVSIGFKGKAGVPFIAEGEANGAVKVTAKWVD